MLGFLAFPKQMRQILFLVTVKSTLSVLSNSYFCRRLLVGRRLCKNLKLKLISFQIVVQVFAAWKTFLELTFLSVEEQMSLYHLLFVNNSRWFLAFEKCVERTFMLLVCSRDLSLQRFTAETSPKKIKGLNRISYLFWINGRGKGSWEN